MDMKQEMMDDTMDGVMGEEGEEEETDEIINQVLDEIGINLTGQLGNLPTGERGGNQTVNNKPQPQLVGGGGNTNNNNNSGGSDLDDDLSTRLNNLRNKKN